MTAVASQRYDLNTWIDGVEVTGRDRLHVRYPYTGEVIGSAPRLTRDCGSSIPGLDVDFMEISPTKLPGSLKMALIL